MLWLGMNSYIFFNIIFPLVFFVFTVIIVFSAQFKALSKYELVA